MAIFDFLSLPGEMRNLIYRFTLTTDPPELDREHKYNCQWCTWNRIEPQNLMYDDQGQRLPGCKCWARDGPALLLANRQINEEGSSIFWAENQFTFRDTNSFVRLVGERLRPRYQQMISSIIVLRDENAWMPTRRDRFWVILFRCKGLRHLEIPSKLPLLQPPWTPDHHNKWKAAWDFLKSQLPNVKTFSRIIYRSDAAAPIYRRGRPTMMKITKRWTVKGLSPVYRDIASGFNLIDELFARQLNGPAFRRAPYFNGIHGSPYSVEVVPVSTERPREYRCVVHGGPSIVTWTFERFFLPLGPDAIARNHRLRAQDKIRAEEEERIKKAEMADQCTWDQILSNLSLVLKTDLTGLGLPSK